jgi:hypothetical protein
VTIGIGAYGPGAGLAVYLGLRAAERVGSGAIGGFATFAAITADGALLRHETQRGGSRTLFLDGETTGVPPPVEVAEAIAAAVISSGPERPAPLSQFLAADGGAGLVTGHRLPNGPSVDGNPLNAEALGHLARGLSAEVAVNAVIDRNPEADVGLIAVDLKGGAFFRNSARVARRPDLGHARLEDAGAGAVVEVTHNAIRPGPAVAAIVAATAMHSMAGRVEAYGWVTIEAGIPVELAEEDAVHCGDDLVATRVTTTDPILVRGRQVGAAIYLHSAVYRGPERLGLTLFEPIVTIEDGRIVEMSGQRSLRMSYRAAGR